MNILVTGGTGYIGTELVKVLAKNSKIDRITVYDNLSRGNFNFFIRSVNKKKSIIVSVDCLFRIIFVLVARK